MDLDTLSKIALAALPVIGAGLQLVRGQRGTRKRLKEDLELLALMPEGIEARSTMLEHLDKQVRKLMSGDDELRRDPIGIGMGIVVLSGAAILGYFAVRDSAWWWIAFFPVAIFGMAGLLSSMSKRPRDDRGRIVS
jgi:hypothetical protein